MSSIYKYFHESEMKIDNFEKALKLIKDENLVVDAEHLKIIEAAEMAYCMDFIQDLPKGLQSHIVSATFTRHGTSTASGIPWGRLPRHESGQCPPGHRRG